VSEFVESKSRPPCKVFIGTIVARCRGNQKNINILVDETITIRIYTQLFN